MCKVIVIAMIFAASSTVRCLVAAAIVKVCNCDCNHLLTCSCRKKARKIPFLFNLLTVIVLLTVQVAEE